MNKPNRGVFPLNEAGLKEAYKIKTDREIASEYGVSDVLVSYYRRKWGIPTVTPRQRREAIGFGDSPSLDDLTPAYLADLYTQMGDAGIAARYGVAKPAIRRLRNKWGIQALTKTDRAIRGDILLTETQQEVVLGTLLGDAHLDEKGTLKVSHAFHQLDYLRRIHALLAPLSKPIYYEERVMSDGVVCFAFGFNTAPHAWIKGLYDRFYPGGVKVFPDDVLDNLSVRSLAYWYQDDGHRDESNLPSFALGDITEAQALEVARRVGARFGFDTFVPEHSLRSSCKIMEIRAVSKDTFFQAIKEFITPDMVHKLQDKYRPVGIPIIGRTYTLESKLPRGLLDGCRNWLSATSEEQNAVLDTLVAFWRDTGFPYPSPKAEEILVVRDLRQEHVLQDGVLKNRHVGQASCHAFAKHIWEATSFGSAQSPRSLFDDPDALRATMRMLLESGRVPSASNLRSGLRYLRRSGVYNFRPSAAKVLVDRYCRPGGTVFDPCAGYGGRLFGAVLSDARPRYLACEPQSETFTRLHDLRDWVDTYLPGSAARVVLHNVPAEDFFLGMEVDMVLTSPPYWKREVYGIEPTQSGIRYPTYTGWLEGFWKPVLEKSVRALRDGGWVVLNVDNFTLEGVRYELVADTCKLMADLGMGDPRETFQYAMPTGANPDNHEMVLCWTRGVRVLDALVEGCPKEEFSRCLKCGKGTPFGLLLAGTCSDCVGKPEILTTCKGCGVTFTPHRSDHLFHDEACHGRWRRARARTEHPPKTIRTFTCTECGGQWDTPLAGRFTLCPPCKEQKLVALHTRVCAHCGDIFTDTSSQNGMVYCGPGCRGQAKQLRKAAMKV